MNDDRAAVGRLLLLYFVAPFAIALALQFFLHPWSFTVPAEGSFSRLALRLAAGALIGLLGAMTFGATVAAHRRTATTRIRPLRPACSSRRAPIGCRATPNIWAFALAQAGISVALGSVVVSLLLGNYLAARPEEAYLERKFGERYRAYRAAIRRRL